MATLEQIVQFTIAVLGEDDRKIGEKKNPVELTVGGQVFDTSNVTLADAFGQATLWSSGGGGLTSFDYLLFKTNADVFLEIANTTPNPDERALFFVAANSFLVLPSRYMGGYASNTSRLDGAAMVEATDFDEITEIRVQRNVADLAGDATVRLVLID